MERDGLKILLVHAANSSALLAYKNAHFDMVRPGIALYGYHSSDVTVALEPNLKPVMTLTAPVTFVKKVRAGETVSYGAQWTAPKDTTVATVRMGYADGYPRGSSGRAEVLVGDVERPVVGRICMDQMMVDVGGACGASRRPRHAVRSGRARRGKGGAARRHHLLRTSHAFGKPGYKAIPLKR